MNWPNSTSVALPVPEIIAIGVLDAGCDLLIYERVGRPILARSA